MTFATTTMMPQVQLYQVHIVDEAKICWGEVSNNDYHLSHCGKERAEKCGDHTWMVLVKLGMIGDVR